MELVLDCCSFEGAPVSGAQALSGLFPGSSAGENLYKLPRGAEKECVGWS